MFCAFHFGDIHESTKCFLIEYLSVGSEHRTKFESEHIRKAFADFAIDRDLLLCCQSMQAGRLENNRSATETCNAIHLAAIERNHVAGLSFYIGARNERDVRAPGFPRPPEHITFCRTAEVIRIAGVHVHGVRQTRAMCGCEMRLEGLDCNPAVIFKWQ